MAYFLLRAAILVPLKKSRKGKAHDYLRKSIFEAQRLFWCETIKKDAALCGVKKEILFSSCFFSGGEGLAVQFVAFAIEECQYYDYNIVGTLSFTVFASS